MIRFFVNIYNYLKHRRWLLWTLLLFLCVILGILASRIRLKENIADFLPQDPSLEQSRFVMENMPQANNIILSILPATGDTTLNKEYSISASEYLATLIDSLCDNYLDSLFYRVDSEAITATTGFLARNIAYYLDKTDYERLDSIIAKGGIEKVLQKDAELLGSAAGGMMLPLVLNDPLMMSGAILEKLRSLDVSGHYEAYDGYLFATDGSAQIMIADVTNNQNQTDLNTPMVERLQQAIDSTVKCFPEVRVIYFGPSTIAVSNASQIKADSYWAIGLSVTLIMGLLWYALRRLRAMLLVILPVGFGAVFAVGTIYLLQGEISAIALGAGSIIFGIAISYSIHFVLHAHHTGNMESVIRDLASPMTVGSLSTIGAFLSLLFLSGHSMRDFGLFAAFSLTGAIFFTLVFLPHLFRIGKTPDKGDDITFRAVSSYHFERNRYVVWGLIVGSLVLGLFAGKTSFDTNLGNINYMTSGEREALRRTVRPDSSTTTLYVAAIGSNMEAALVANERVGTLLDSLIATGGINAWSGLHDFVPSKQLQSQRLNRWQYFWTTERMQSVNDQITLGARNAGFRDSTFTPFLERLKKVPVPQDADYFKTIPAVDQYMINSEGRCAILSIIKTNRQMAEVVRTKIASQGLTVFDTDTINRGMIDSLVGDFNFVLYVCGFIVFGLLWLSLRRIEITLVAFLPMLLSWVWILGIMGLFGIDFNVVNVILASFIFGLGDDFSIFITDGLMQDYAYGNRLTRSHKSAVILSALTMLFGIGTLIFAQHPAMLSLAQVTIIGMLSVVIMAYIVPPLIFGYLVYKRGVPRMAPITLENFSKSIYAFVAFLVGSMALTVQGFVMLTLLGRSDANKLKYHNVLYGFARFVVRHLPMIPSRVLNPHGEEFAKPAVIIANHQSHLDLMFTMMLSPKIVILTNRWVWRSPFYGIIIRYADYLPIAEGIENSVEKLRTLTDKGYSVVVFPEGTRSRDSHIGRFHKGAFYLAERLGLDLLPIVIHGLGDALPRQEFLLRPSSVTVSIMGRVQATSDYNVIAKQCRKEMCAEHDRLREIYQTPDYFRRKVLYNYIYKGAEVEREARLRLRESANYQALIDSLPSEGVVLLTNCGIGVAPLMAALVRPNLTIYATDPRPDKLSLANNCASVPSNLHYVTQLPADITFTTTVNCYEQPKQ